MTFPYPTSLITSATTAELLLFAEDAAVVAAAATTHQLGTPGWRRWVVVVQTSFDSNTANPIPDVPTITGVSHTYTDGNSYSFSDDGEDSRVTLFHIPNGTEFQFSYLDTTQGNRGGSLSVFVLRGPNPDTLTVTDEGNSDPTTVTFVKHAVTIAAALNNAAAGPLDAKFDVGSFGGGIDINPTSGVSYSVVASRCDFYSLKWY